MDAFIRDSSDHGIGHHYLASRLKLYHYLLPSFEGTVERAERERGGRGRDVQFMLGRPPTSALGNAKGGPTRQLFGLGALSYALRFHKYPIRPKNGKP